jgi:hypothetical protein
VSWGHARSRPSRPYEPTCAVSQTPKTPVAQNRPACAQTPLRVATGCALARFFTRASTNASQGPARTLVQGQRERW